MTKFILVFDTFAGLKHEEFKSHKEAFKAYKEIMHTEKGVYLVNEGEEELRQFISPINISFSQFEVNAQLAKKYLLELYRNYEWRL